MCSVATADSPQNKKITFEPDPEIQKLILVSAYAEGGNKACEALFNNLDILKKRGGENHSKLVPNLIYYTSRAQNLEEGMAAGVIIHYLGISERQIMLALLPYVGADDELFRKELEKLIVDLEPGFRDQQGFEYIYLGGYAYQKQSPPLNAVEFLFRKGPGAALLTMTKYYRSGPETEETRAIKWAEYCVRHVLALKGFHRGDKLPEATKDAVKALDELSQSEEWWVRLYVAEILNQHPEFRTEAMTTRLSFDTDDLVRKAISRKPAP